MAFGNPSPLLENPGLFGVYRIGARSNSIVFSHPGEQCYAPGMAKRKMPNARKTLQPPERDYSHRSLLNKLGVKSGHRIFVLDILDSSFLNEIKPFAPTFEQVKPRGDFDLIFFGAEAEEALKRLAHLRKFIRKNGGIWVVYPKGKQHIRENDVISAGKAAGLTDTKVCRFSPTHTALRFVIPLVQR